MSKPEVSLPPIVLFDGIILEQDTSQTVPDIRVSAYYKGVHIGSEDSGRSGQVKVVINETNKLKELRERAGDGKFAYDLFFCQPLSIPELARRPVTFNRQGLYCEGRSFDFNAPPNDNAEIRFIQKAIQVPTSDESVRARLTPAIEKVIAQTLAKNLCVVTGGPGTGKTTTLGMLLQRPDAFDRNFGSIVCYSFESDSSSRFFELSVSSWAKNRTSLKQGLSSRSLDYFPEFVRSLPPTLFLIDEIDEASNSGFDRGWAEAFKRMVHDIIDGSNSSLGGGHKMILTARGFPRFLRSRKEQLGHAQL